MLGAIAGDMIGSAHEWSRVDSLDFELFNARSRFTDDSVMTLAVAKAILESRDDSPPDYRTHLLAFARRWPNAGYGSGFRDWFTSRDPQPYNSWGNGSAMRVSPVGFAFDDESEVLAEARRSAEITHNHPEGIKGAQSVALAIFLGRRGTSKDEIRSRIETGFGYDLRRTVADIQPTYSFDVSCQGSVPEAMIAFLDSTDFESAVRNAVFLGGDADTQGCIAGGIAEAFYGSVPDEVREEVMTRLDRELLEVAHAFEQKFPRRKVQ